MDDDKLITATEVSDLFSVRPGTVRDAAWRGRIPCIRLWEGKKKALLRFRRSDIEEFIRQKTIPASHGIKK